MLLTSNWRIPASSSLRAGGYLRRARWRLRGASTDGPAAGASAAATGTSSTDASSTRGDGAWDSTYRRWPPHHFPPPHPTTSSPTPAEGRVPLVAQLVLLVVLLQALQALEPLLLCARCPVLLSSLRGAAGRLGPRRWRVRPRGVHIHHLRARIVKTKTNTTQEPKEEEEAHSPLGRRGASRMTRGRRRCAAPT
jgi:hypothetical protein